VAVVLSGADQSSDAAAVGVHHEDVGVGVTVPLSSTSSDERDPAAVG
jgi:hypothetical protein